MSEVEQDLSTANSDDEAFDSPSIARAEWQGRQTDWLLQWLVKFINQTSTKIGVTLTIGGSQIAGDLTSHDEYFALVADAFSEGFRKFDGVDVAQLKELMLSFNSPPKVAEDQDAPAFQYLHLSNVSVISGGNPLVFNNGLWRGKISAVEGFMLGRDTAK
jgi:hypothetical protein